MRSFDVQLVSIECVGHHCCQVPEAEVEAEYSSAASEFTASGQEFDEQRLREQVVEALKARLPTGSLVSLCLLPDALALRDR